MTGTPASQHNPPCKAAPHAKNIAQHISDQAINYVGKAVGSVAGMGDDPFNVRRLNKSVCADLCVIIPQGSEFTAEGSLTPWDWKGPLPTGLPGTIDPKNYAAIEGPFVEDTDKGQVVCYTYKNWKHDRDRLVGLAVTYPDQ
jgi:hypothetical protein